VVTLGVFYDHFRDDPALRHLFAGLAAAAAGLLVSTALKMLAPLRTQFVALGIVAVSLAAIAWLRLPLLPTMLVLAPVSIVLTTWKPA
jgi:chromate transporter